MLLQNTFYLFFICHLLDFFQIGGIAAHFVADKQQNPCNCAIFNSENFPVEEATTFSVERLWAFAPSKNIFVIWDKKSSEDESLADFVVVVVGGNAVGMSCDGAADLKRNVVAMRWLYASLASLLNLSIRDQSATIASDYACALIVCLAQFTTHHSSSASKTA